MRPLQILVAAAAVLLFLGLDASTIWDANEAFYVETPRQMVETGDYVNPSFNGAPRFNKPVLNYWIVAAFYKVLGVSVWSQRVAIALGALGIAAAAFVIARVVWSLRAGWLAALIVLSAPRVVFFARRIFIDVWITLFMSLVLMFFVLAEARPEHRRRYLLLMYVAAGLGVLTKGPIAVVLPALAFAIYRIWQRRVRDILTMHLLPGALIVLAIVVPWYALIYVEHGWGYIRDFFIGENLGRYSETVGEQNRPFYFYLPVLFTELFPWSLFGPIALWIAWRLKRPQLQLLVFWIAAIVLVFTFSNTKQDLYIFPIVAALAALIAGTIDRWIDGKEHAPGFSVTWVLVGLALFGMSALLMRLFGASGSPFFIRGAHTAGVIMAAGALLIPGVVARHKRLQAVLALGLAMIVVNYVLVLRALPDFERFKPVAPLSSAALRRNPDAHVVQFRTPLPSMVWYLRKPVEEVHDEPILLDRFARDGETLVLLSASDYEYVKTFAPPTCVIARHPLMDVKPREILNGTALPEMLLISNRCW
jgi:4-amino-4-deoxy-L-arabinose transferase-like glycosyltransferase